MSRCDLEVVLERPGDTFRGGERVVGMVIVRVNSACTCNGLDVALRWTTHGRGNRRHGAVVTERLFTGEWKAGEEHIHPFELVLPDALAPTSHGTLLNIDWEVHATADIPWAFDPEASAGFEVAVAPGAPHDPGPLFGSKIEELARGPAGQMTAAALIFVGIALIGLFVPVVLINEGDVDGEVLAGVVCTLSLFLGPLVALLFFFGARRGLAEKRLGEVRFDGPPGPVRPGENTELRLAFTPQKDCRGSVRARLLGQEVVVSGSGSNRRTHTHEVLSVERELRPDGDLAAGQAVDLPVVFRIPEGAPSSFEASDNAMRWVVEVRVDVKGWPDWTGTALLHVAP